MVRGGSCFVWTLGRERKQTKERYLEGRLSGGLLFFNVCFVALRGERVGIIDSGKGSLKKPDVMNEAGSLGEAGEGGLCDTRVATT